MMRHVFRRHRRTFNNRGKHTLKLPTARREGTAPTDHSFPLLSGVILGPSRYPEPITPYPFVLHEGAQRKGEREQEG